MNGYKILVTGGLGFIGRHLINKLFKKGYRITIIDNQFRWKTNDFEDAGIKINRIHFVKGNICDEFLISRLIQNNEIIIHLASISQVITSIHHPDKCFEYNVIGTKHIVKYCTKYKKRLIFASSREVYGTAQYLPVDLSHPLIQENPYGASKITGESLIHAYSHAFGLEYFIFRLSNVYGYGDKERVVPIFIEKAIKHENIIIYGNNKIIDFIYIDDVVDAFLSAIEQGRIKNETVNLGSGTRTTLEALARSIIKLTGSSSKIVLKKSRIGEVDRFVSDLSYTKKVLDWEPQYSLEKGLKILTHRIKKT